MAKPRGRPSTYTPAMATTICQRIAEGESLNAMCQEDGLPSFHAVYDWLNKYPDFSEKYARAREIQAEKYADDIITIADTADDPVKARLQVDARKWAASKLAPKKYGDKVQHAGADGESPVEMVIRWQDGKS